MTEKKPIAIVCDDRPNRVEDYIAPALEKAGYEVRTPSGNASGVNVYRELPEDDRKNAIIVTSSRQGDVFRPGSSDLWEARDETPHIPIVMYTQNTGFQITEQEVRNININAGYYIYDRGKFNENNDFINVVRETAVKYAAMRGESQDASDQPRPTAIDPKAIRASRPSGVRGK